MEKTLIPNDVNMTRSHLPAPAVSADSVVIAVSPEAKLVDSSDNSTPKPPNSRCRLCESTEDPDLLIKPCRCDGSKQYVHRDCLDQMRAFNENNQAFMHCRDCEYRYWIDVKESYNPDKTCCGQPQRVWHFRGLVARDTAAIFILLQGVITLFAFVVERADSCASLQGCGAECGDVEPWGYVCGKGDPNGTIHGGVLLNEFGVWKMNQHYKTTYYFLGLLFFLATIGVVACLHSCCWFCDDGNKDNQSVDGYTNSCVDQYTCYYCWYDCPCCWSRHSSLGCCCYSNNYSHRQRYQPVGSYIGGSGSGSSMQNQNCCCQQTSSGNCNCGTGCGGGSCNNCDCKGGNGDGAAVLVVVAIVLFIILVVVGFIYGLILLTLIMTKIIQKHYAVAQRRQLTRAYIVRDLDGVFLPAVGEEQMIQGHVVALPSAPPINEIELRAFGIL